PLRARLPDLLRWNAELPGGARYVLTADRRVRLRADCPVDGGADPGPCVQAAWKGFKAAARWFHAGRPGAISPAAPAENAGCGAETALEDLCREAGWSVSARRGGLLVVDLDVPGAYHQAWLEPSAAGARLSTQVAALERGSGA